MSGYCSTQQDKEEQSFKQICWNSQKDNANGVATLTHLFFGDVSYCIFLKLTWKNSIALR